MKYGVIIPLHRSAKNNVSLCRLLTILIYKLEDLHTSLCSWYLKMQNLSLNTVLCFQNLFIYVYWYVYWNRNHSIFFLPDLYWLIKGNMVLIRNPSTVIQMCTNVVHGDQKAHFDQTYKIIIYMYKIHIATHSFILFVRWKQNQTCQLSITNQEFTLKILMKLFSFDSKATIYMELFL